MLSGLEWEGYPAQLRRREQGREGSIKQKFGVAVAGSTVWFCGGGRRAVGAGKYFVTFDPLHRRWDGNPEPSKNGRKNVEKLGKLRKWCDTGESQRGGAGSVVTVSNSDAAVHQQRHVL